MVKITLATQAVFADWMFVCFISFLHVLSNAAIPGDSCTLLTTGQGDPPVVSMFHYVVQYRAYAWMFLITGGYTRERETERDRERERESIIRMYTDSVCMVNSSSSSFTSQPGVGISLP